MTREASWRGGLAGYAVTGSGLALLTGFVLVEARHDMGSAPLLVSGIYVIASGILISRCLPRDRTFATFWMRVLAAALVLSVIGVAASTLGLVGLVGTEHAMTPEIASIQVTPAGPRLALRSAQQLTAIGILNDETIQDVTTQVQWSSTAASVASVSEEGMLQAVAVGETTIRATLGGVSCSTTVIVAAQ